MSYDVIIVGVGGMGSAAAWQLARRGRRVLGIERYDIPHGLGSSHGVTRIIRLPYYEDPAYVPLLRRAYELWREIEAASGQELLVITGSVDASHEDDGRAGPLSSLQHPGRGRPILRAASLRGGPDLSSAATIILAKRAGQTRCGASRTARMSGYSVPLASATFPYEEVVRIERPPFYGYPSTSVAYSPPMRLDNHARYPGAGCGWSGHRRPLRRGRGDRRIPRSFLHDRIGGGESGFLRASRGRAGRGARAAKGHGMKIWQRSR